MKVYCLIAAVLLMPALSTGCAPYAPPAYSGSGEPRPAAETKYSEVECSEPDIEGSSMRPKEVGWMREAWVQFVADGRYCVPGPGEFSIPEMAKADPHARADLDGTVRHPYGWGDFNKDTLSQDFVAFVIDKTRRGPDRFGVVIFNEPKERGTAAQPHWVLKDRDLSKSTLHGGGGLFLINTYHEDGSSKGCLVRWDDRSKSYSCEENFSLGER